MRSTLLRAALIVGCASVVSVWYPIRGKYAVTSCSHCLLCIRHVILISHGLGVRQDVTHDTFIGTSWLRNYRQMWLSGYSALTLETSAPGLPGYYVTLDWLHLPNSRLHLRSHAWPLPGPVTFRPRFSWRGGGWRGKTVNGENIRTQIQKNCTVKLNHEIEYKYWIWIMQIELNWTPIICWIKIMQISKILK